MKLKLILTRRSWGRPWPCPACRTPRHRRRRSMIRCSLTGSARHVASHIAVLVTIENSPRRAVQAARIRAAWSGSTPPIGFFHIGGPVTCLAVNGNTATISFADQMDFAVTSSPSQVVDDQSRHLLFSGPILADRRPTVLRLVARTTTDPLSAATLRWSMHRCRPQRTNARVTAGSSSASRIRGCASPSSSAARRRGPPGCRSRPGLIHREALSGDSVAMQPPSGTSVVLLLARGGGSSRGAILRTRVSES